MCDTMGDSPALVGLYLVCRSLAEDNTTQESIPV